MKIKALALGFILVLLPLTLALPPAVTPAQATSIWLTPARGSSGQGVALAGSIDTSNGKYEVYWDSTAAGNLVTSGNATGTAVAVAFLIPPTPKGMHKVILRDVTQGTEAVITFTVIPVITIRPDRGKVGTEVTISGRSFAANESNIRIIYDGTTIKRGIAADANGGWTATFKVPPGASGNHTVNASGDSTFAAEIVAQIFTLVPEVIISPTSGTVGTEVKATGTGFVPGDIDIRLIYDGTVIKEYIRADDTGSWTATITIPASPRGKHQLTASSTTIEVSDLTFTVMAKAELNPTFGYVNSEIVVTGNGFGAKQGLRINYDATTVASNLATDENGSFAVSFKVPESKGGGHTVTAIDTSGATASLPFILETVPPPMPKLISPENGARFRFFGGATPAFDWSDVDDPSGVYYTLEISQQSDFTTVILRQEKLTESQYALTEREALPKGDYYWRVRAIDGADNQSQWTTPQVLSSGVMSLRLFIAICVIAFAIVVAIIYRIVSITRRGGWTEYE